jgi:hypothetical protein
MSTRILIALSFASLFLGGVAMAQNSGSSSGPAAGKNAEPSTAIQKQEGRSADEMKAPSGAGAPGIEAKPGTQSGALPNKGDSNNSMNSNKSQ